MIRKSKPHKYNYGNPPELLKEEPVSSRMERAMQLPNSGPGVAVRVPLELLPYYLEWHRLEPMPQIFPVIRSAATPLVLKVSRVPKEKVNHE